MLSMILGSISRKLPIKITPSITINGLDVDPPIDFCPRTCKEGACPAPCCCDTVIPVTVPRNTSIEFVFGNNVKGDSAVLITLTDPVKFFRATEPYPTTTTSSNSSLSTRNRTFRIPSFFNTISRVTYPTKETRSTAPAFTVNL